MSGIWIAIPWAAAAFALLAAGLLWRDRVRLRERLLQAEVRRLRTQLNPHFLYNTLNAISELGYNDPKAADEAITRLSQLLRKSLDDSNQHEIALRDEIAFLERYLAIQAILLRERLETGIGIESDALNARVPGMIVQPLVENAIMHGVSPDGIARVSVGAKRLGNDLVVEVADRGAGLDSAESRSARGIGLANIRARLLHLYGNDASLTLQPRDGGGLLARLAIPFHEGFAYDEAPRVDRR
jgi:LytS/YehU family sensor histidine kinase